MNCVVVDDEVLALKTIEKYILETDSLNLVGSYSSALELINALKVKSVDLIFLDVQMPDTKPKILVVEDEMMLLKTIEFRLKKEGFEIVTAPNGKVAKEMIPNELPDLIVSDIMMPYVSGLELVKHVKDFKEKDIPVILLTTLRQETNVMKAFELGADEFMTKPFSPAELVIRVKRILLKRGYKLD